MIQPRNIASFPPLPSGQAAPVLAYRAGAFVAVELTDLAAGDSVPVLQLGNTRRTDGAYLAPLTYPTPTPEPPPTPITYPDEGIPAPALPHTFEVLPGDEVLVFVGPLAFTGSRYEIRETDVRRASLEALAFALAPPTTTLTYLASYLNDSAAAVGGVTPCALYRIAPANAYGATSGGGRRLLRHPGAACTSTYANDAAASAGGVALGEAYTLAPANAYGVPHAGGRAVAVRTDGAAVTEYPGPFRSDTEAAAAGVPMFVAYLVHPANIYGVESAGGRVPIVRTA